MDLFDVTDYVRLEKLDKTVDAIRNRYGKDVLKRAAFIQVKGTDTKLQSIDHMEGGVSREKRSVDYSKIKVV
jgi:DNA polymerase-4